MWNEEKCYIMRNRIISPDVHTSNFSSKQGNNTCGLREHQILVTFIDVLTNFVLLIFPCKPYSSNNTLIGWELTGNQPFY